MDHQEGSLQTTGSPLSSETFAKFMQQEHINHITPSPHYPKSNGFIERQIKTIKTALSTGQESKQSIKDILLNIRAQPIGPNLPSPRDILHNRKEEQPRQTISTSRHGSSKKLPHLKENLTERKS